MATDPGTIDHLLDQLSTRGATFTTKRMFGEYCLYRDGLPVALVCDDQLFVKDTEDGRRIVETAGPAEFGAPYPGARAHLRLSPDLWDDGDWLRRVLDATAAALPPPKPRARPKREPGGVPASPKARKAPLPDSKALKARKAAKPTGSGVVEMASTAPSARTPSKTGAGKRTPRTPA